MRALLATGILLVAACNPGSTTTASGGGSPVPTSATESVAATTTPSEVAATEAPTEAPTEEPTAGPTVSPTSPPGPIVAEVIPPGSAIEVTVASLNLRLLPTTGSSRVELLERGDVLIVSPIDGLWIGAGPRRRDGYTWYPVIKAQVTGSSGGLPLLPQGPILYGTEVQSGWIATDNGSKSYVKQLAPRCPDAVNLTTLQGMLPAERLACFGGQFQLEGTNGCPACGAELIGAFDPVWLSYPQSLDFLSVDAGEQLGPVILRFKPDGPGRPVGGTITRSTVHVDDPASAGCSIQILDDPAVPDATAELYCREQIVVDAWESLGTDPGFGT